ncbi:hypothetical protein SGLAM104S_09489 [Streptomyces glaucescens]
MLGGPPLKAARRAEAVLHRRIGRFFTSYDVVLAPTTATPPPRIGALLELGPLATDRAIIAACPYAWPWNVLGWPGVGVPAGFVRGAAARRGLRAVSGPAPAQRRALRCRLAGPRTDRTELERWSDERRPPGPRRSGGQAPAPGAV